MKKITNQAFLNWIREVNGRQSYYMHDGGYTYGRCDRIKDVPFLLYRLMLTKSDFETIGITDDAVVVGIVIRALKRITKGTQIEEETNLKITAIIL